MTDEPTSSTRNPFVGTWRMVSASLESDGKKEPAFGERPLGMLCFTEDMHYVEVLMDADTPKFANPEIGKGTDEENRAVVSKTIGIFGSYKVNEKGEFTGDTVEGCTMPNWIGDVRGPKDITVHVDGDQLSETFHQPGGATIEITYDRVR